MYENVSAGEDRSWIKVRLVGTTSNRSAIGARLRVEVDDGAGGKRSIYRTVGTGASFGANPLRQHIGLGGAEVVKVLEVRWPVSGKIQRFEDVAPGREVVVTEGEEALRQVVRPRWNMVPVAGR